MRERPAASIKFVLAVVGLAVAAASCSRGSTISVRTGAGTSPAEDHAVAERVVLHAVDLPGFEVATAAAADTTSLATASNFESCAGAAAALGDVDRIAQSPGFFKGRTTLVSSLVVVAADEAQARAAMSTLSRGDLGTCVTALFRSVLSLDQIPGTSAKTESLGDAKAGDQSTRWRTTIQVTAGTQTATAYSDITFVRSGRTVAVLFDFQVGEPLAAAERSRLVKALTDRMD